MTYTSERHVGLFQYVDGYSTEDLGDTAHLYVDVLRPAGYRILGVVARDRYARMAYASLTMRGQVEIIDKCGEPDLVSVRIQIRKREAS